MTNSYIMNDTKLAEINRVMKLIQSDLSRVSKPSTSVATQINIPNFTNVSGASTISVAATITVGTITTLPAGSPATVTNSGTSAAAIFDFGIPQGIPGTSGVDTVVLGDTFATNQPFQIISGVAQKINSLSASFPYVDGITLESGVVTNVVNVADGSTIIYTTPLALPGSDGDTLYLGQTGLLTNTVPSSGAGDVWFVPLARRVTSITFVYDPQTPIELA